MVAFIFVQNKFFVNKLSFVCTENKPGSLLFKSIFTIIVVCLGRSTDPDAPSTSGATRNLPTPSDQVDIKPEGVETP